MYLQPTDKLLTCLDACTATLMKLHYEISQINMQPVGLQQTGFPRMCSKVHQPEMEDDRGVYKEPALFLLTTFVLSRAALVS